MDDPPVALLASIVGHAFLILYQTNGGYIVGPNDGFVPNGPFKHFLYESYQAGHFTYAKDFGSVAGSSRNWLLLFHIDRLLVDRLAGVGT